MSELKIKDKADLVETPAPGRRGNDSTRHLNLLVPGGSSERNTLLPAKWSGDCCHLHWYCPNHLHRSHHHKARPLSPKKAGHRQAHQLHHHHSHHHSILGPEPEGGLVDNDKLALSHHFIFKSVKKIIFSATYCTWERWKLPCVP